MDHNTVRVDTSTRPATLTFADSFNAAVAFVDRHLAEGRGARVAIRSDEGDTTYAELAEQVNRAGNTLTGLGLGRGDRVIMAIKDCPAFFFVFWGAIKAGLVPVPVNTLLRARDFRHMIEDSGAACVIWSPEFAAEMEAALADCGAGTRASARRGRSGENALRPHGRSKRPTCAPRPATADSDCFWLYTSGSTGPRKASCMPTGTWWSPASTTASTCWASLPPTYPFFRCEAFLCVRPRERHDLPVVDRGAIGTVRRPSHAHGHVRTHRAFPAHPVLRGSNPVRLTTQCAGSGNSGPVQPAGVRLRRGAAAGRDL